MWAAPSGAPRGSGAVLPQLSGTSGASGNGNRRVVALVRAAAGRTGTRVVDRGRGQDSGGGDAQAKDRRARRRASARVAVQRAVREDAHLDTAGGQSRSATVAVASPPAGADAHPGEEPAAFAGHQRRPGAQTRAVEPGGAEAVSGPGTGAVGGTAAAGQSGIAVRSVVPHRSAGSGSGTASGAATRGGAADDSPRGGSDYGAGFRTGDRGSRAFSQQQKASQLSGTYSQRRQLRRQATAGPHQQAGQCAVARPAGGSRARGGAARRAVETLLPPSGHQKKPLHCRRGRGPQAGGAVVVD